MKRLLILLGLFCATIPALAADPGWHTDLPGALEEAKRDDKFVLLDFTGSDWCGWCMKLKSEVFDQPGFIAFAQTNLLLVEIDFPRHKIQAAGRKEANEKLAREYDIEGYPTIILLDKNGKAVAKTGYVAGGPDAFIISLGRIRGLKHVASAAPKKVDESTPSPAPAKPAAPAPAIHYGQLALKGISGPKDRYLALINNQTFMAGETAQVKVEDKHVEVLCKEIRPDSVLITVDGNPMELKLRTK
jgi:protein disulfide-isomerase